MKEDYLWDKTGEDSEIEELESRLKTFRTNNSTPPTLPANTFVIDRDSADRITPNRFFKLAFATFACIGLVVTSIGIVRVFRTENLETTETVSKKNPAAEMVSAPQKESAKTAVEDEQMAEQKITKTVFISEPRNNKRIYKAVNRSPKKIRYRRAVATRRKQKRVNQDSKEKAVVLTPEEKDAYEQLMRALTITSSKLKIVRDKVNGAE